MIAGRSDAPAFIRRRDDERDNQRIKRDGFGQRKAKNGQAEHAVTGSRIAGDAGDQRAEDRAHADADPGESDHCNASTQHLGGSDVHSPSSFRYPVARADEPARLVQRLLEGCQCR
jgi:hypothetical protein